MADRKTIPTPLAHRWRRFRYSCLPFVTFGLVLWVTLWMWDKQTNRPNAVGEVEAARVDIAAPVDGRLLTNGFPAMFDQVAQNDVIAMLDDTALLQEKRTMSLRRQRMEEEIETEMYKLEIAQIETAQDNVKEKTRLAWEVATRQLRIDVLEVDLAEAQFETRRLTNRLNYLAPLFEAGSLTDLEYNDAKDLKEKAEATLKEMQEEMQELITQRDSANASLNTYVDHPTINVDLLKRPLLTAIAQQKSRMRELEIELEQFSIKSPISGMVTAIYLKPGQIVEAGNPILAVSQDEGQYIISYIRQDQKLDPVPNQKVLIKAMAQGSPQLATTVTQVGARIEKVPGHQRRDPRMEEWGLPVKIKIPVGFNSRPGELLDVTFKTKLFSMVGARGGSTPSIDHDPPVNTGPGVLSN